MVLSAALSAQRVTIQVPVAGALETQSGGIDEGVPVEMFESPNLDRFLRRARDFLEQEKYQEAIQVLQSVIEGRTLEAIAPVTDPATGETGPQAGQPGPGSPGTRPARADDPARLADPAQTVFSHDGRIYRPARRLCHEYLAGMPPIGIGLYRSMYEAAAAEALQQALQSGNASELERVGNRWFVTEAAGQALRILAERHMHDGRYRAAVQVLRDLSELYPVANLRELGISPIWCRFKIALCIRLAGDVTAAREAARQLAIDHPNESLRIMGELQPVSGLADSPLFAAGDESLVADLGPARDQGATWIDRDHAELVPLWQYRFRGRDPYAPLPQKGGNDNGFVFVGEGVVANATPPANKYGTGTQVVFAGRGMPRAQVLFLEHFRLRMAQAFTGVLLREGDGSDDPPQVGENRPRMRVPAYDFALMRPVDDGQRWLVVVGHSKSSQSVDALKNNEVIAYDQQTGARLWSTGDYREGDDSFLDVTFLAAPVVFGERLLAPVLRRGAYSLQCFERATGRPVWCTRIHSGGTPFFKAPGSPVHLAGNLAYVVTNAGALAAIDAFAGDLRWIRRYERRDPLREQPMTRRQNRQQAQFNPGMQYVEQDLPGYLPSDLIACDGLVITAPCDGDVMMAVDGASGEPVWMIDGSSRYAPYGRLHYLVGANDKHLFAASETDLVCIELRSGVRLWHLPLPTVGGAVARWRGRGCLVGDTVVMPGDREVLVAAADGKGWQRLPLPAFGVGDEPLAGPCNLYSSGPWLAVCYARGIQVFTTAASLLVLADAATDPVRKAEYQVQAGHGAEALGGLMAWLGGTVADQDQRRAGTERLVALARAEALAAGQGGLSILDRVQPFVQDRQVRLLWHLARLDLCRHVQDLAAYEAEQQRLYRFMEGKDG